MMTLNKTVLIWFLAASLIGSGCARGDNNPQVNRPDSNKSPASSEKPNSKPTPAPKPSTPQTDRVLQEPDITDQQILEWRDVYKEQRGVFTDHFVGKRGLLISLGQQPTGGYSIVLKSLQKVGATWKISYLVNRPKPGAVLTQALTYPHQLLALPDDGSSIEVSEIVGPDLITQSLTKTPKGPVSLSKSFILQSPVDKAEIGPVVKVQGLASVFEGAFLVLLKTDGQTLAQVPVQASAGAPAWGSFAANIPVPTNLKGSGLVVLAYGSAATGEIIEELSIPVTFK